MEEDNETCDQVSRSWEEEIYWTRFGSHHFFQFLHGDFKNQLAVPKKFACNMKNKLGENVILKGPSGSVWKVGLSAEDGELFFKKGWEDFVKDHSLSRNDLLMFKHTEGSRFEVLVFDGQTMCEKEAAYFCKRRDPNEKECESGMKRKGRDDSEVATVSPLSQEPAMEIVPTPRTKSGRKIVSPNSFFKPLPSTPNAGNVILIDQDEEEFEVKSPSSSSTPLTKGKGVVVRRRPADEDSTFSHVFVSRKNFTMKSPAQERAIQQARAAAKSKSFSVVMQPSHVYKRFYLSIPVEWAHRYLTQCSQNIILRVKDMMWRARYNYTSRNTGGISAGWKNFALENHLKVSDVCLFELGESLDDTVVFDVTIFRVNESAVSAVPVDSAEPHEEIF